MKSNNNQAKKDLESIGKKKEKKQEKLGEIRENY
jgi:hypothetical protein